MAAEDMVSDLIDLKHERELVWDVSLCPEGEGGLEKEEFEPWWERSREQLSNLHPQIAEQWVHRHWANSPFCFLPLSRLSWTLEDWATAKILNNAHILTRPDWEPEHDYKVFNQEIGNVEHPTAQPMNTIGTWDYPIILLETPEGVRDQDEQIDTRHILIEGHLRAKYLNALHSLEKPHSENHKVFVLKLKC